MAAPFEDWYRHIPVVTRLYMTGCVVTSAFVYLDVVNPLNLYLNYPLIMKKFELWRLATNFLFYDHIVSSMTRVDNKKPRGFGHSPTVVRV
eukprot:gene17277-20606_t